MQNVHIDTLVAGLRDIPEGDFTVGTVYDFLKGHPVEESTLAPYLFFSGHHYTRNLIYKDDLFELILVCWDVGQSSQIHNHDGQLCWMAIPSGRLRVQNFRIAEQDARTRFCRVEPTDFFDLGCQLTAAEVDPEEPVHQVLNLSEFGSRALSLHVYSRPYNHCVVYSTAKNEYRDMELKYSSEYGRLCAGERL